MNDETIMNRLLEGIKAIQDTVFDFEQAKKYLGVSTSSLYKYTHEKKIKYSRPNGGKIYFKRSDLDAWLTGKPVKTVEEIEQIAENYVNK